MVMRGGIIVHGGAGAPRSLDDGPERAAIEAMKLLSRRQTALDAACEAARIMEDDGRFNAGSGSVLRFDGLAYMDASVMTSDARCGAVALLTRTRNPVLVARKVMESPHILMAGEGAVAFARKNGFPEWTGVSARAKERLEREMEAFRAGRRPRWPENWRNYTTDTIGAVVSDGNGGFAAAASTGGTSPALHGRVGDVPLIGCGIFAGAEGAVACTGIGEEIIRRVLARYVYGLMESGMHPEDAVREGLKFYDPSVSIGIIAIGKKGAGVASTTCMAHFVVEDPE